MESGDKSTESSECEAAAAPRSSSGPQQSNCKKKEKKTKSGVSVAREQLHSSASCNSIIKESIHFYLGLTLRAVSQRCESRTGSQSIKRRHQEATAKGDCFKEAKTARRHEALLGSFSDEIKKDTHTHTHRASIQQLASVPPARRCAKTADKAGNKQQKRAFRVVSERTGADGRRLYLINGAALNKRSG